LPVTVTADFTANFDFDRKLNVLGFTSPENVGMNPLILNKIEAIAQKAINGKMALECKF
jgi:hypothetical protein